MLILGETGVGKEVLAETLHRAVGAQRAASCASTARRSRRTLLESELFGHEKGAFTGADAGASRPARGGAAAARCSSTRSASCRRALQAKLLRVLETREVLRVGARQAASPSTCASSRRPTAICDARSRAGASAPISTSGSTASRCVIPPLRERRASDRAARAAVPARSARRAAASREPLQLHARRAAAAAGARLAGQRARAQGGVERALLLARGGEIGARAPAASTAARRRAPPVAAAAPPSGRRSTPRERARAAAHRRRARRVRRQPDARRQAARHLARDAGDTSSRSIASRARASNYARVVNERWL